MRYWIFLFLITYGCTANAQYSQDTLQLDLQHAESLFLKNNLQLLAQKYSMDSAQAAVVSAKLWDNPEFDFNTGFFQPDTKKFFDYSDANREIGMQVSQLIKTAGKRNKAVVMAKTGVTLTSFAFFDLLRTLKYTLRNDFYNIYYLQQTQKVYDTEIKSLQQTATAFAEQVKKGNIAEKDLLRIQSQLYTLQAEQADLQNTIDDVQSEFKLLIRAGSAVYVVPVMDKAPDQQVIVAGVALQTLVDSAYDNRYDLKAARENVTLSQQNLALQRALAIPDVTFNIGYDRLGSYVNNYNSVGLSVPLPLLNRNQGNIKQARAGIESSKLQLQGAQDVVESEVANAYLGAVRAEKLLNSFDPKFEGDFNHLIEQVTDNFTRRNLSILEFIDFYDSYKQNVMQLNNLRFNRISQLEQLNFTTGTSFFNK